MNKIVLFILTILVFSMCGSMSNEEKEIRACMNTILDLSCYEDVLSRDTIIAFEELRSRYNYLSIVYLENGCRPCYSKYISWIKNMDSLLIENKSSVLFIEQGDSFEGFLSKVNNIDSVQNKYYFIEDYDFRFIVRNSKIPRWIIDRCLLIDKYNKIKLIGEPFASPEMENLYKKVCNK